MILILNAGSSSIKYKLFLDDLTEVFSGLIEEVKNFDDAFGTIYDTLLQNRVIKSIEDIQYYGHRVVHGGEKFKEPILVNEEVLAQISKLISLAPLHNPSNLNGITTAMKMSPLAKQIAVFDTAYHQSMPDFAYMYALPYELYERNSIRRYGFHGTSHEYVAKKSAEYLQKSLNKLNLITIHLGNGASVTAIKNGKSIDTSMGFTPLEGLMMGTRSGDIDPAIIFYLHNELGLEMGEIEKIINKKSGFKGICQKNDLRAILKSADEGDEKSRLAIDMFCYRVKKYVGSYKEVLGNIDAIVFTGGIGENSTLVREKVSFDIDVVKNNDKQIEIQKDDCSYKIMVINTNEELEIAEQVQNVCNIK